MSCQGKVTEHYLSNITFIFLLHSKKGIMVRSKTKTQKNTQSSSAGEHEASNRNEKYMTS